MGPLMYHLRLRQAQRANPDGRRQDLDVTVDLRASRLVAGFIRGQDAPASVDELLGISSEDDRAGDDWADMPPLEPAEAASTPSWLSESLSEDEEVSSSTQDTRFGEDATTETTSAPDECLLLLTALCLAVLHCCLTVGTPDEASASDRLALVTKQCGVIDVLNWTFQLHFVLARLADRPMHGLADLLGLSDEGTGGIRQHMSAPALIVNSAKLCLHRKTRTKDAPRAVRTMRSDRVVRRRRGFPPPLMEPRLTAIFTDLLRMSQAFEFFSKHYLSVAFVVVVSLNPDHLLLSEGGFSRSRTRNLREGCGSVRGGPPSSLYAHYVPYPAYRVEHLDIAGRAAGVYEDTIFGGGWYEPTDIELLPQDWTEDAELDAHVQLQGFDESFNTKSKPPTELEKLTMLGQSIIVMQLLLWHRTWTPLSKTRQEDHLAGLIAFVCYKLSCNSVTHDLEKAYGEKHIKAQHTDMPQELRTGSTDPRHNETVERVHNWGVAHAATRPSVFNTERTPH
ncbi:hypothetical protein EV121DRAFT_274247 [Schizophyllum commune]